MKPIESTAHLSDRVISNLSYSDSRWAVQLALLAGEENPGHRQSSTSARPPDTVPMSAARLFLAVPKDQRV